MTGSSPSQRRFAPSPAVHSRLFDGELVILDLARGEYLALDAVGAMLWQGLESGKTVADVAAEVVAQYEVSLDRAADDLDALAADLVARGLLLIVGDG